MKKTVTTIILILVSFVVYGQSIVKSDDFKVVEITKDSTGRVRSFKTDFHYKVTEWKTNSKGVIVEMMCSPDVESTGFPELNQKVRMNYLRHLLGKLEFDLGLDNIAPNNQTTAKYKSKDYTYIVSLSGGYTKIILNN